MEQQAVNIEDWEIYLTPGMGNDSRLFDHLQLDPAKVIRLEILDGCTEKTLPKMAGKIAEGFQPKRPFALVGVSMGGMVSVEMAKILEPDALILISSAKNKNEIPNYYRFFKYVPLHHVIPGFVIHFTAGLALRLSRKARRKQVDLMQEMLKKTGAKRLRRQMDAVLAWKETSGPDNYLHIHGTNDIILPGRKVKDAERVEKVGHELILKYPQLLKKRIFSYLEECANCENEVPATTDSPDQIQESEKLKI